MISSRNLMQKQKDCPLLTQTDLDLVSFLIQFRINCFGMVLPSVG